MVILAHSAAICTGAKCPTDIETAEKGAEWVALKQPKNSRRITETPEKPPVLIVFRVFRLFFQLFFGCFTVTHSAPFSAVFFGYFQRRAFSTSVDGRRDCNTKENLVQKTALFPAPSPALLEIWEFSVPEGGLNSKAKASKASTRRGRIYVAMTQNVPLRGSAAGEALRFAPLVEVDRPSNFTRTLLPVNSEICQYWELSVTWLSANYLWIVF